MTAGSLAKAEHDIPLLDITGGIARFQKNRDLLLSREQASPCSALQVLDALAAGAATAGAEGSLFRMLSALWSAERTDGSSDGTLVHALQKKFALFGRLAARYDEKLRKAGEELAGAPELGLLAALLLLRFLRGESLNELNSALKLIDAALALEQGDTALPGAVLILERQAIERILE